MSTCFYLLLLCLLSVQSSPSSYEISAIASALHILSLLSGKIKELGLQSQFLTGGKTIFIFPMFDTFLRYITKELSPKLLFKRLMMTKQTTRCVHKKLR
jgi:hypothetical protein